MVVPSPLDDGLGKAEPSKLSGRTKEAKGWHFPAHCC